MSDYEDLSYTLHLKSELPDLQTLQTLKNWCEKHISRDIAFTGTPQEEYTEYCLCAQKYLDVFLPQALKYLEQPCDDFDNMNTIQYAALNGYEQFIQSLTTTNPYVFNAANEYEMTPLHLAASEGHLHTVEALLNKGANKDVYNKQNQMPLASALSVTALDYNNTALHIKKEAIFRMLSSDVSIMHKDISGESVFHLLTKANYPNLLSEILQQVPKGVLITNNRSQYPIHTCFLNLNQESKVNNLATILEHSKDLDIDKLTDSQRKTPLHYAAEYGSKEMIELCIADTKDINKLDSLGQTPLILAARHNNQDAIMVLLAHGAEQSIRDSNKKTFHDYTERKMFTL